MRKLFICIGIGLMLSLAGCGGGGGSSSGPAFDYNGSWNGTTSTGGPFTMTVQNDKVTYIQFEHNQCKITITGGSARVSGNTFEVKAEGISIEKTTVNGTFTSQTTVVGSYSAVNIIGCFGTINFNGTFNATRQ